jgi:predicted metalloendopeptidase
LKYKEAYIEYIVSYSSLYRDQLNTGASDEDIKNMAEKIYAFEKNIASMMWTRTENRDPANTQRKFVLSEVIKNDLISDWSIFLNDVFEKVSVTGIDTDGSEVVNVSDEKWFNNTNKAIEEAKMSDNDLKDYVAWRVHMSIISYLGKFTF